MINFFSMFEIAHKEKTHSNLLFTLLQYKAFQEIFFSELINIYPEINLIYSNNQYIVKKEFPVDRGFIDLLLYNSIEKQIILIENKFNSKENGDQLNKYLNFLNLKFKEWSIIPIYLSFNNSKPSNNSYFLLRYDFLIVCIKKFQEQNNLDEDLRFILNHYINLFV